jgi:hypothetical protein
MARIDLLALQQRLTQQPPTPVPAEPPSWRTRPAPASALCTTSPKVRPAAASAVAPAGTLRATTTMRATLPLKATNAREERARANALRAQIDELKAEMVMAYAEADRVLAEERQRADRLNEQVELLSAEVVRAEKQAEAAVGRAEQAEAGRDAEHARAEALHTTINELKAGQATMMDMHAHELAAAQRDALAGQQAAAELRRAEAERWARGLVARLRAAWRGE